MPADYEGEYSGGPGRIAPRRKGGQESNVGKGRIPVQDAHVELTPAEMAAVQRKADLYEKSGDPDGSLERAEAELRGER